MRGWGQRRVLHLGCGRYRRVDDEINSRPADGPGRADLWWTPTALTPSPVVIRPTISSPGLWPRLVWRACRGADRRAARHPTPPAPIMRP